MKNQLETWERWLSKLTILCIIIATAPAPLLAASQQGSVTIAVQWGANSPLFQGLRSAIELFEKRYPGTQVETLSGYGVDKLNVAVAGGTPPDAYQVGAQWVIPYGVTGVLQPLNEHIARSGIKLESDFIPPMVAQSRWRGQVYAIPLSADINFALFRNVDILDAAGVDAQREITFFDELQAIIRKVTRYDADGSIVQAGYVPWPSGDMSNDLLTWGLAFGGSFYDPQTLVLRSSDAANVEALEWLREEQARIGGKAGLTRLQAGLRGGFHRVSNNNIAFSLMYPNPILHIQANMPELRFALGSVPHKRSVGHENPVWAAGPMLAIPTGAANATAAFQLIRFLAADVQGSEAFASTGASFPAFRQSPHLQQLARDPVMSVFFRLAQGARFSRPPIPNQRFWVTQMNAVVDKVINGGGNPRALLEEADRLTTQDLEASFGIK